MKKETKKRGNLIQKSINLTPEELIQVENFQANLQAKSLSEAIIILMKRGLENVEYMEMLTTTLLQELKNNREQQAKDTNRIIAVQQITGKNVYALKAMSYKAEAIKGTFSVVQNEEQKKKIREEESNLKEFDSKKFEEYFKETRSGGKDNENI